MKLETKYSKVMIFGVFDNLHDGHRFFIGEASKLGDELVVVVARDTTVQRLKDHNPIQNEKTRQQILADSFPSATIILGDENENKWNIVLVHKPCCIALGYDQNTLRIALEKELHCWPFLKEIVTIGDHDGQRLHSSML